MEKEIGTEQGDQIRPKQPGAGVDLLSWALFRIMSVTDDVKQDGRRPLSSSCLGGLLAFLTFNGILFIYGSKEAEENEEVTTKD